MTAGVVVAALNRPDSLERLLTSLLHAEYSNGVEVPLIISIDRETSSGWHEVCQLANAFEWPFGSKEVIEQKEHLGLIEHLRQCGSLTERYGDIILLEDDLLVAPPFFQFATAALDAYRDDDRIAGVCLYGLWFNGFTQLPFMPVDDGCDVFFLKLPYTQGLAFTAEQWRGLEPAFRGGKVAPHPDLHPSFLSFGADEWFPHVARELAATNRFFCFPRASLTVGSGDSGTHFSSSTDWLETPVQLRATEHRLPAFEDALAVYDSFYEILPDRLRRVMAGLPEDDFDIDLNATKPAAALHSGLVLTTRPVRQAIRSFGLKRYPAELNLSQEQPGGEISLALREHLRWGRWAEIEARRRLHEYAWRRHRTSRRRSLSFAASRLVESLRSWRK